MAIVVDTAPYGSYYYQEALNLRRQQLRTPLGIDFSDEEMADEPHLVHIVALKDGILAGALSFKATAEGVFQLKQMCVEEGWRKRGIGGLLIRHAERVARAHLRREIWLNARTSAQRFYEKYRYKAQGDVFSNIGIDHIKMTKSL